MKVRKKSANSKPAQLLFRCERFTNHKGLCAMACPQLELFGSRWQLTSLFLQAPEKYSVKCQSRGSLTPIWDHFGGFTNHEGGNLKSFQANFWPINFFDEFLSIPFSLELKDGQKKQARR